MHVVPFGYEVAAEYSIEAPVLAGRIVTWDPHRSLVWKWDDERVTYELEPTASGTRLTCSFDSAPQPTLDETPMSRTSLCVESNFVAELCRRAAIESLAASPTLVPHDVVSDETAKVSSDHRLATSEPHRQFFNGGDRIPKFYEQR